MKAHPLVGGRQEPRRHIGVPPIGGMNEDTPQETRRLNEKMAFPPIELLRAVIAMGPFFGGFDRLRIDDGG